MRCLSFCHIPAALRCAAAALGLAVLAPVHAGEFSDEFDRQRFKSAFQHEIAFREAALHVAWSAEPLCDDTSEIEPFVLWSLRGVRKGLSSDAQKLFTQATGMDGHWRIAWLDESAPDTLRLGQRVLAVNQRPLPAPGNKVELSAVFRGGSAFSVDDQAFCTVMHQARQEANADSSMVLTTRLRPAGPGVAPDRLRWHGDGHRLRRRAAETSCARTACAARSPATPFWPPTPGMSGAGWPSSAPTSWPAARSILRQRSSDSVCNAFLVCKVLALAVPGMGTVLSAMESQTQRGLQVDGLIGGADLFANEVVLAMGGDPSAGLKLSDRLKARGLRADVVGMSEFRRATVEIPLQQLALIEPAGRKAGLAAEVAEAAAGYGVAKPP